jgi:hypothetical protein
MSLNRINILLTFWLLLFHEGSRAAEAEPNSTFDDIERRGKAVTVVAGPTGYNVNIDIKSKFTVLVCFNGVDFWAFKGVMDGNGIELYFGDHPPRHVMPPNQVQPEPGKIDIPGLGAFDLMVYESAPGGIVAECIRIGKGLVVDDKNGTMSDDPSIRIALFLKAKSDLAEVIKMISISRETTTK